MVKVARAVYIQLGGLLVVAALVLLIGRYFPVADFVASVQQHVMRWGAWGVICYPLLYACCNVLLLPGGVLNVGGGFFFGLWWGFFAALMGNVAGAAVSFLISRSLGRRWLRPKLVRYPRLEALEPAIRREGWKIILLTQLHPLFPTSLLNYLYGLTPIRFRTCMLWVAVGQAPCLFLYAYLGTLGQLGLNLFRGQTHPRPLEYFVWGGGLIMLVLVLSAIGRVARRMLEELEKEAMKSRSSQKIEAEKVLNV